MTVSPVHVSGILIDPGPLCPGETALLTCTITQGTDLIWTYGDLTPRRITTIVPAVNIFPPSGPILVDGVNFTVTVLSSTSPDLVSQISFVVSATVNGRTLECSGVSTSSGAVSRTLTLQVEESISKFIMLHHYFSVTPQVV